MHRLNAERGGGAEEREREREKRDGRDRKGTWEKIERRLKEKGRRAGEDGG